MTDPAGSIADRVERAIGVRPSLLTPLAGGCVADVRRADLPSGESVVVKTDDRASPTLEIEGRMLRFLRRRSSLPVPAVIHAEPSLLVLEHVENDGTISSRASEQRHAAELLGAMHSIRPDPPHERSFGFVEDTLIGPLAQPNAWRPSWIGFFRERRLLAMTREAEQGGSLPASVGARLRRFAERLDDLLIEPESPSLVHGDAGGGNILVREGRVAAFIDPAISFSHPEIELAFGTLFGTFSDPFFGAYSEIRPIAPGFHERRRDVYNLYPLLVHVRLFGGGYLAQVDAILRRFGA